MKKNNLFGFLVVSILIIISCNGDDEIVPPRYESKGIYDSGILVLNKGSIGNQNAGISYLSFELNANQNNVFQSINNTNLGSQAQSMFLNGDLAYIVVSGSNTIEIINRYSMQKQATISAGLNNPKYLTVANGKAYVTNQGSLSSFTDDYVSVYNLTTNALVTQIPTPNGILEKCVATNNKVYVAKTSDINNNNQILVIDAVSDVISSTIPMGFSPNSLEIENGFLWVLCGGNSIYSPNETSQQSAKLVRINLATNSASTLIDFQYATTGDNSFAIYPANLTLFSDTLYFTIKNGVYKVKETNSVYSFSGLFQTAATNLLGFGIKSNNVYVGDAKDYAQTGSVLVYSLGTSGEAGSVGALKQTINIGGIAPNGFYFNL